MRQNSCSSTLYCSFSNGHGDGWRKRISFSRFWRQSTMGDVWHQRMLDASASIMAREITRMIDADILNSLEADV